MEKVKFNNEEIQDILNKYQNNWSQQKIADAYKVSRNVIKRILKENQVQIRKKTGKYKADYDIFEKIDNVEKAYWLGFLAADGCNYQREHNSSIIINISEKDKNHLEKFKQFCNTDANIISYKAFEGYSSSKGTQMCKIVLNSQKMSNDLVNKGIVPKKSLILQPPKIAEQFYLPFILGYFDGDGSIYKTSQYNNYGISIEGTKELLQWIKKILNIDSKLEKRYNDNKNNYYIRCGGTNKPYNILKQLYDSCDIYLERKYLIYKSLETVVLNSNVK